MVIATLWMALYHLETGELNKAAEYLSGALKAGPILIFCQNKPTDRWKPCCDPINLVPCDVCIGLERVIG